MYRILLMTLLLPISFGADANNMAQGSEAACRALAAQVEQAATRKHDGASLEAIEAAAADPGSAAALDSPRDQHYYTTKLPGALRFGYSLGLRPQQAGEFYFKQCSIGS